MRKVENCCYSRIYVISINSPKIMLSSYITLYQPLLIYKNINMQRWLVFAVAFCFPLVSTYLAETQVTNSLVISSLQWSMLWKLLLR